MLHYKVKLIPVNVQENKMIYTNKKRTIDQIIKTLTYLHFHWGFFMSCCRQTVLPDFRNSPSIGFDFLLVPHFRKNLHYTNSKYSFEMKTMEVQFLNNSWVWFFLKENQTFFVSYFHLFYLGKYCLLKKFCECEM